MPPRTERFVIHDVSGVAAGRVVRGPDDQHQQEQHAEADYQCERGALGAMESREHGEDRVDDEEDEEEDERHAQLPVPEVVRVQHHKVQPEGSGGGLDAAEQQHAVPGVEAEGEAGDIGGRQ